MYGLLERVRRLLQETCQNFPEIKEPISDITIRKGRLQFPCDVEAITDGFLPYTNGAVWSGEHYDDYALFRFTLTVPKLLEEQDCILRVSTNKSGGHNMVRPQMLLFINGKAVLGLDTNHEEFCLSDYAGAGELRVCVYAFSGLPGKTPYGSWVDIDTTEGVRLFAGLEIRRKELCDFYYNLKTPYQYLQFFEENTYEHQKMLTSLNDALSLVDFRNPHSEEFYESIKRANTYLKETLYAEHETGAGHATLVGHTHIDVAWLWRYEHTRDKAVRSFATEIELLKHYPEHRFMSSQAQLYDFVKQENPELYEEIKTMIAAGQWEAEGAMWVEPDMNLVSGESIVLQILYGKKFFREEFGAECKVLWLPDVFGYTAALPQILKKAGVDYFMTSKLATNEKNRFPFDTFSWKGIDGSEVLAHCTSYLAGAYCPDIENGEVLNGWRNYLQKNINDDILVPFGFADGGGGVTKEQLEAVRRLSSGLPGVPKTEIGTVGAFFDRLRKKVGDNKKLPTWSGEIYYEKHRGTYTSMARVKKQNRQCEFLYSNAQWLFMLASCFEKQAFPKAEFETGIKHMLMNQFHDVLPGTSIFEVYEDVDALYREAFAIGEGICQKALDTICADDGDGLTVINPFSEPVSGYAETDGTYRYVEDVPAKGFAVYPNVADKPEVPVRVSGNVIENQYYILTISEQGEIESLYDKKAGRQCFIAGKAGNHLRIFEDKPMLWSGDLQHNEDNWNLDSFYTEREFELPKPDKIFVKEANDEYAIVRIERTYGQSRLVQEFVMYARSPRIDIKNDIDWHEHSQILKAEFPVDVNAVRATYEIQFGYLERPTVCNTSWDEVKFEVCAHKWADISDNGYGVAVMNDCKYGYSAKDSTLSLTMLRCGNSPNPEADKERHQFVYSILPHMGDFRQAEVVKEAYLLNNPLKVVGGASKNPEIPSRFSLFTTSGAVLDTIKPAEDGDGWILRFYEPYNKTQRVCVSCGIEIEEVIPVNLMEEATEDLTVEKSGTQIFFDIKPFELISLRVRTK